MTRYSGAEFLLVGVSKCREDLSVYNEFLLSPSTFGAAEVTFCFRQLFCMLWRFRANHDDAVDGWCVFVDDSRDYGVMCVNQVTSGRRTCGKRFTDVTGEHSFLDGRILFVTLNCVVII